MMLSDDGLQLSAVLEKPERERCPLVIFIHGFGSTKDKPHNVASCEAMREAGFATLRVDMYGHGESGGTFRNHTVHKWISNILAVMDYAQTLDWVTDIYLSGHSQGGLAAAMAAGMAPDKVKGLILRAPAFVVPRCAREGNMLGRSFDPLHLPDEIPLFEGQTLSGNYLRFAQMLHPEEAIDRFPGPVLILHGNEDDMVPLQDSIDAAKHYRNAKLEIMHGETHHFNRYPEQMKDIIRSWLQSRSEG